MSRTPAADDWQILYREAVLESAPAKVPGMIDLAYHVIQRRAFELWYMGTAPQTRERLELDSALYFLDLIKKIGPLPDTSSPIDGLDKGPSSTPADWEWLRYLDIETLELPITVEAKVSLIINLPIHVGFTLPPRTNARILILDNDEDVLVNLERVLENEGYTTATAVNYEQAEMMLSQRPFDLLILDDHLSDRDSVEVVAALRSLELVPPFVVVTYYRRPARREQTRLSILGVSALINKLGHDELTKTVRAILATRA